MCTRSSFLLWSPVIAHVAGWGPYNLHDLGHIFLGWVYVVQSLRNISWLQVRIYFVYGLDRDLSDV